MWQIPIQVKPAEVRIEAGRRLGFQVITAFGSGKQGDGSSSKVLAKEDGRLLVEFRTSVRGLFGKPKEHRTVEWVTLHEPERIEFEGVEGPLAMMRDQFTLEEDGECTRLIYESEFAMPGWVAGWLVGILYVRPILERFMWEHLLEIKKTIEARAKRSKVFIQRPCASEEKSNMDAGSSATSN